MVGTDNHEAAILVLSEENGAASQLGGMWIFPATGAEKGIKR